MARRESDREDLLREATALVERVELLVAGFEQPIVVGFRRDACASLFFGDATVYQFNSAGELRRGYIDGLLYKADRGRLIGLKRERTEAAVELQRLELDAAEIAALLARVSADLRQLSTALHQQSYTVTRQVPPDKDLVGRVAASLQTLRWPICVAQAPNAR
jgi:hypothetical protein